jgi:hypothetical protein
MPANVSHFWTVRAYLPYVQDPLTDEALSQSQTQLSVTLPQSFVDVLMDQSGGHIRYSLPEIPHRLIAGSDRDFHHSSILTGSHSKSTSVSHFEASFRLMVTDIGTYASTTALTPTIRR